MPLNLVVEFVESRRASIFVEAQSPVSIRDWLSLARRRPWIVSIALK